MTELWITRKPNGNDLNFIYATWLNSYQCDSWAKSISKSVFFDNYKLIVDSILEKSLILIACLKEDHNVILGYLIYEPGLIHYCFVKDAFRRLGIAKDLYDKCMQDTSIEVTHRTQSVLPILKKKPNLIFNPFKLYQGVSNG